jgi:hypothetical protein
MVWETPVTNFGFFNGDERFRQKFIYYHYLPSATTLGFRCTGKNSKMFEDDFFTGINIQNCLVILYQCQVQSTPPKISPRE